MAANELKDLGEFVSVIDEKGPTSKSVVVVEIILILGSLIFGGLTALCVYNNSGSSPRKIALREELMLLVLSILLAVLAIIIRTAYNGMRTKLVLEALASQRELNSLLAAKNELPAQPSDKADAQTPPSAKEFVYFSRKSS